ncbi:MAG: indole-3-glycerol phosphate synthase TrpC [Spirochaetaceae bacterium]|jgi:indole-3-glycerol phosphate synthase|nr:indole-3-glycerol phosphate synthase TrpC [Spirochaetaceae bacterium]
MILDDIAASTQKRVALCKQNVLPAQMIPRAEALCAVLPAGKPLAFETSLQGGGLSVIAEVKKASPSKGIIAEEFPYLQIAKEYEEAGAAAISVLTEPEYFKGSDQYLKEISSAVKIPLLRKDFIIDEYQIYEAKVLGASAVLLICALLNSETLSLFQNTARKLGLAALVEVHNEAEIDTALKCGAVIIGINNRDLKTFNVDINTTRRLFPLVPENVITVSESGIKTKADLAELSELGVNAVLIGEALMLSSNKKSFFC